jgi:hypothetical protein
MLVKKGASLRGCKWQVWYMSLMVDAYMKKNGYGEAILTSGSEGKHKHNTHGLGYAGDYRNHHIAKSRRAQIAKDIQELLGKEYNFIEEFNPDHFHGEYDPRHGDTP